jgi:ribosomal protein S18 acetylase RimI-like enzyme
MLLRDLRLRALSDSPAAFGSTYEGERPLTEADWRERLTRPGRLSLVALLGDQPAGIAGGHVEEAGHVEVVSMWVVPSARGRGVGDALVDEVLRWARELNVREVRLWVTRGNVVAERLYERHGFERNGDVKPLPSNPCVDEIGMRLGLSEDHTVAVEGVPTRRPPSLTVSDAASPKPRWAGLDARSDVRERLARAGRTVHRPGGAGPGEVGHRKLGRECANHVVPRRRVERADELGQRIGGWWAGPRVQRKDAIPAPSASDRLGVRQCRRDPDRRPWPLMCRGIEVSGHVVMLAVMVDRLATQERIE